MPDEKQDSPGFKVVDRRLFGEDGALREDARRTEKADSPKTKPPASSPSAPAPERPPAESDPGFETLVSYLSTTALFQLGLLAGPGGEAIPPDPVNAHRTINLLEVLQRKTRGNLTSEESRLLEDVLYDLRMSFLEIEKRLTQKNK